MEVIETHLRDRLDISDDIHALCNWQKTNRDNGSVWGGTGIFIDRRIQYENSTRDLSEFQIEVTVMRITLRSLTICFCSVYIPHSRKSEIFEFLDFLDIVILLNVNIL